MSLARGSAILALASALLIAGCRQSRSSDEPPCTVPPAWSHAANIYELNVRQFTEQGTLPAAAAHLPRLRELGVDIVWLMPIHPIGVERRKGTLGSYYSVRDYLAVNPEFGDLDDLRAFVDRAHELEMRVLLDWVANHTAWDNPLVVEHPDWFTRDARGAMIPPVPDWSDVVDLSYDAPGLRRYMIDALLFWVREANIDGFRCDVAELVPLDFWRAARSELDASKPVFMLAEGDRAELHRGAFDMSYGWSLLDLMNEIAAGEAGPGEIERWLEKERETYAECAYRMYFTSNHDKNSWDASAVERLGEGLEALSVLAATIGGMPLIYGGQEAGLDQRLEFFERDPIHWRPHPMATLYRRLLLLKRSEQALWNGSRGARATRVTTSVDDRVFAFDRRTDEGGVRVVLNLSPDPVQARLADALPGSKVSNAFTASEVTETDREQVSLAPWDYRIWRVRPEN